MRENKNIHDFKYLNFYGLLFVDADESSSFLLEVSGFLRELGKYIHTLYYNLVMT